MHYSSHGLATSVVQACAEYMSWSCIVSQYFSHLMCSYMYVQGERYYHIAFSMHNYYFYFLTNL